MKCIIITKIVSFFQKCDLLTSFCYKKVKIDSFLFYFGKGKWKTILQTAKL